MVLWGEIQCLMNLLLFISSYSCNLHAIFNLQNCKIKFLTKLKSRYQIVKKEKGKN